MSDTAYRSTWLRRSIALLAAAALAAAAMVGGAREAQAGSYTDWVDFNGCEYILQSNTSSQFTDGAYTGLGDNYCPSSRISTVYLKAAGVNGSVGWGTNWLSRYRSVSFSQNGMRRSEHKVCSTCWVYTFNH